MSDAREWLIRKDGYYYRPNCSGYTTSKFEAGRYTKAEAEREAAVEPWHMKAIHQDDVEDDTVSSRVRMDSDRIASLQEQVEKLTRERDERDAVAAHNFKVMQIVTDYLVQHDLAVFNRSGESAEDAAGNITDSIERLRAASAKLREGAEPVARGDLSQRCREILDWRRSGVLRDDASLHKMAQRFPAHGDDALRAAEDATYIEACAVLSRSTTAQTDARSGVRALQEFAKWAIREGAFQAADLDGVSIQEKAQELGLIEQTTYDPSKHGPSDCAEAGDEWFVFSPTLSALSPAAPEGREAVTEDDVAARLWKAEAEDAGAPASIVANRTRIAFDDQADTLKDRWRKFARAAIAALAQEGK